jgi:perosamine synthetase
MNDVTAEKRRIGLAYHQFFGNNSSLTMQPASTAYSYNMYWVVGIVLPKECDARTIAAALRERGVDTRPFFYPLHQQPVLAKYSLDVQPSLPVSERLGRSGLYLPSFVGITDDEIAHCASSLLDVLAKT